MYVSAYSKEARHQAGQANRGQGNSQRFNAIGQNKETAGKQENMSKRIQIKKSLRKAFGDRCYWCGGVMGLPRYGEKDERVRDDLNIETLEHHLQKEKRSSMVMHLRLAHRGCNR